MPPKHPPHHHQHHHHHHGPHRDGPGQLPQPPQSPHARAGQGPHAGHGPGHPVGHPPIARTPASRALAFVDLGRLDGALAGFVPVPGDRAFLIRCLVGEGPIHHRGANYVLIAALAQLLPAPADPDGSCPAAPDPVAAPSLPVAMRLPPHLAGQVDEGHYPVSLPTALLSHLAGGDPAQVAAMADCLTDGPPQHALANVVMLRLLEQLWADRHG